MDVMSLMAKIGLDSSDYDKGLDEASGKFSGFGQKIASGAKTIGKVGVAAFAAIGTAVTGATVSLVKNAGETAAYADNIDKMSQKMGFSAEKFQEWDFIMQHNGSSIEAVKSAMMKLNNSLESGSDAYGKLGLSIEQMQSMSAEDRFEATVAALQNVTDETERAALAQDIFGRSYQELGPLLNSSNEDIAEMKQQVHDLGGVMSDDAVKSGAAFQDSLQNLKTTMSGVKNNLMGEFLPSLTTVMDGLTALFSGDDSGIEKIKQGIEDFAKNLSEKLPKVVQLLGRIAESLISALPQFFDVIAEQLPTLIETLIPVLINAVVGLANAIVKALPKIMEAIRKNIKVISQGLTKIISAIGQIIMQLLPTLLPTLLQIGIELIKELARGFIENASEVIKVIFELINMIVTELTNPDTLSQLLTCGIKLVLAIANGLLENLPMLLETVGTLLSNVIGFLVTEGVPQMLEGAIKLFEAIGDGIGKAWNYITGKLGDLLFDILGTDGIGGWLIDITSKAKEMFEGIGLGIMHAGAWIWEKVTGLGEDILKWIGDGLGDIFDIGKNLVEGLWNGITSVGDWIKEKITGFGNGITGWLKDTLGISSPSKVTAWMGKMLDEGLAEGVEDGAKKTFDSIQDSMDKGMDSLELSPLEADIVGKASVASTGNPLMDAITTLSTKLSEFTESGWDVTVPVYIGNKQIDEIYVDSKQRVTLRSGGQVNV